jgi:hypothetical protein
VLAGKRRFLLLKFSLLRNGLELFPDCLGWLIGDEMMNHRTSSAALANNSRIGGRRLILAPQPDGGQNAFVVAAGFKIMGLRRGDKAECQRFCG